MVIFITMKYKRYRARIEYEAIPKPAADSPYRPTVEAIPQTASNERSAQGTFYAGFFVLGQNLEQSTFSFELDGVEIIGYRPGVHNI